MMKNKLNIVLWLMGLVLLALFPRLFGIYYTNIMVTLAIFSVFAVSVNMLLVIRGS